MLKHSKLLWMDVDGLSIGTDVISNQKCLCNPTDVIVPQLRCIISQEPLRLREKRAILEMRKAGVAHSPNPKQKQKIKILTIIPPRVCPESQNVEKTVDSWHVHPKITTNLPLTPHPIGNIGEFVDFANAAARSRDGVLHRQGGGCPPCTSCYLQMLNFSTFGCTVRSSRGCGSYGWIGSDFWMNESATNNFSTFWLSGHTVGV